MKRVLIAGPGRSGTSVLVKILSDLGLSTSADGGRWYENVCAGFESDLDPESSPLVVKNPSLTAQLPDMLDKGELSADDVRIVLIPFRNLDDAAASRWENARRSRVDPRTVGALHGTTRPSRQREQLAGELWGLLLALERHDVAYQLMHYPRFLTDVSYFEEILAAAFPEVPSEAARSVWHEVREPGLVRSELSSTPNLWSDAYAAFWRTARWSRRSARRIARRVLKFTRSRAGRSRA